MSTSGRKCSASRRVFLYLLFIPTYVLYAVSLTGCLSTFLGIPDLFLVQITSTATKNTIKVAYFGICGLSSGPSSTQTCTPIARTSEAALARRLCSTTDNTNPSSNLDLIHLGVTLASKIFLPVLAGAVVAFTLGILFFITSQLKARRTRGRAIGYTKQSAKSTTLSLLFLALACMLCCGSALSTTVALSAIQFLAESDMLTGYEIEGGKALPILQWAALVLSVIVALGIAGVMRSSVRHAAGHPDVYVHDTQTEGKRQRELLSLLAAAAAKDNSRSHIHGTGPQTLQIEHLPMDVLASDSTKQAAGDWAALEPPKKPRTPLFRLPLRSASLRDARRRNGSHLSVLGQALSRAERRREGWPYRRYSCDEMV
ncbi:uncharacterized protein DSM5745_06841 [Aspergillus mulundensis]|uniref:Uncharacterized protein n=1 Tax=Aspergillus mulundensis TaxID=1810919 RepID=A0A3D8RS30_9EURO|nr:hypothetical protein DSM5745_06841 [Aspergillus mulundensis]RDW76849.1 hypothetical protein DSM5745_06841 [Aspergillus mulundensis]